MECDTNNTNPPQTINFGGGAGDNGIESCTGMLDFSQNAAFATSNIATASQAIFQFYGEIIGDSTLSGLYDTQWCWLNNPYTLTSTTASQKLFNASTHGAVLLTVGIWIFECQFYITGMSATSGNLKFDILGAGTATVSDIYYAAWGLDSTTAGSAAATTSGVYTYESNTSPTNIVVASTGTAMWARITGLIHIGVAGTIIPSVALVTATAAVVQDGSYFRIWPIVANAGTTASNNWS